MRTCGQSSRTCDVGPCLLGTVLALVACGSTQTAGVDTGTAGPKEMTMKLTSSAFDANGKVPQRHTCDGEDVSPALSWEGVPENAASLTLIMDDPDAPPGTWVHWVLYDLPVTDGLDEGVAKTEQLDNGAVQGACWGVSSFSRVGYYGPCPPPGKPHRYSFRLYALDSKLGLPPRATKDQVVSAMKGHVLAEAEIVVLYGR